jgi:crotonobetainyl-CoA:carnitine CoA-transferase CaiB-like acyl-CoA transferase
LVGSPIRMSETPVEYRIPPPQLGEHTHAVLSQLLGLAETEIATLAGKGVVQICRKG